MRQHISQENAGRLLVMVDQVSEAAKQLSAVVLKTTGGNLHVAEAMLAYNHAAKSLKAAVLEDLTENPDVN